ncbi:fibronectin type III domain-containing protein [Aliikangiella maris]|uniref:Fibronectin type III domain-containing protein n=2 Tax=Aliikangiella maris TaxID=3162458 RepID=A0ABV2BY86_9GAMM
MWVSWKTTSGSESTVEYGLSADSLQQSTTGNNQSLATDYQYHSVQLTGLKANTLYYYRTKTGSETSAIHRFKTQPAAGENSGHLRILVLGDHQIRGEDRYLKLVTAAKQKVESLYGSHIEESINLILNDGDQVDVGTLDHYENLHFAQSALLSLNLPIMTTVGNHEYYSDGELKNYRAHFIYDGTAYQGIAPAADETYYAYQSERVLFVHLNSMKVDSYAEAHPIIYKNNEQVMHYDRRLIDTFERQLDGGAPERPSITNTIEQAITLPYTFISSAFQTTQNTATISEQFNSTQFQIATLAVGNYYAVVLLNDGYTEATSRIEFSVTDLLTLTADKSRYLVGQTINLSWANTAGNSKDWIGIYQHEHVPGSSVSTQWQYITSRSGTATFNELPEGQYYAAVFLNDGYDEATGRIEFTVNPLPELIASSSAIFSNETIRFD